jgi:hypothetical protein
MRFVKLLCFLLLAPALAFANSLSYVGALDPNNADDVFLASFTLGATSDLHIQSWGYGGSSGAPGGTNAAGMVIGAGGFDTYISLFEGEGPSATFLASNDDGGCGPASPDPVCEDSRLDLASMGPGVYTVALTLPGNYSIAENYGFGTLGDGFIDLQGDYYDFASDEVRSSSYAFDIGSSAALGPVPEPSTLTLFAIGLAAVSAFGRRFVPGQRSHSNQEGRN